METEVDEVKDLSSRFEEMEVDNSEEDSRETSAMIDEKIKNKHKQDEEKYKLFRKEQTMAEMKKKLIEEEKLEQSKSLIKNKNKYKSIGERRQTRK